MRGGGEMLKSSRCAWGERPADTFITRITTVEYYLNADIEKGGNVGK